MFIFQSFNVPQEKQQEQSPDAIFEAILRTSNVVTDFSEKKGPDETQGVGTKLEDGQVITIEPGQSYYMQIDDADEKVKGDISFRFDEVEGEQGKYALRYLYDLSEPDFKTEEDPEKWPAYPSSTNPILFDLETANTQVTFLIPLENGETYRLATIKIEKDQLSLDILTTVEDEKIDMSAPIQKADMISNIRASISGSDELTVYFECSDYVNIDSITLHDMEGKLIENLENRAELDSIRPGQNSVSFATNPPSGAYFVRITTADGQKFTKGVVF